jgi:hypothetical protein
MECTARVVHAAMIATSRLVIIDDLYRVVARVANPFYKTSDLRMEHPLYLRLAGPPSLWVIVSYGLRGFDCIYGYVSGFC